MSFFNTCSTFFSSCLVRQLKGELAESNVLWVSFDEKDGNMAVLGRILVDSRPLHRFLALRAMPGWKAQHLASLLTEVLDSYCDRSVWTSKLVGISADGAAVNGVCADGRPEKGGRNVAGIIA